LEQEIVREGKSLIDEGVPRLVEANSEDSFVVCLTDEAGKYLVTLHGYTDTNVQKADKEGWAQEAGERSSY
jgi:hypothetical protein